MPGWPPGLFRRRQKILLTFAGMGPVQARSCPGGQEGSSKRDEVHDGTVVRIEWAGTTAFPKQAPGWELWSDLVVCHAGPRASLSACPTQADHLQERAHAAEGLWLPPGPAAHRGHGRHLCPLWPAVAGCCHRPLRHSRQRAHRHEQGCGACSQPCSCSAWPCSGRSCPQLLPWPSPSSSSSQCRSAWWCSPASPFRPPAEAQGLELLP